MSSSNESHAAEQQPSSGDVSGATVATYEATAGGQTESGQTSNVYTDLKDDSDSEVSQSYSNSELHDYESFFSTSAFKDSIKAQDTSELIQKAITYPVQDSNQQDEGATMSIGARKEKDVIDSLRHENFQLKLRIVVIESQLNQSTGEGVSELRKQLADAQAAKISVQHENSKLRKTIQELTKDREDEYEKVGIERELQVKTLEENLLYYQEELQALRADYRDLEQSMLDQQSNYEQQLRQEQLKSRAFQYQFDDSATGAEGTNSTGSGHNSFSADANKIRSQIETIKNSLESPSSYSRSRISNSPTVVNGPECIDTEMLSGMLKQIQDAAYHRGIAYNSLQKEFEGLTQDYENLAANYEKMDDNFEQVLEELRHTHNAEIDDLERQIAFKDARLEEGNEETMQAWQHLEQVKQDLEDLEQFQGNSTDLAAKLQSSEESAFKLKSSLNQKDLELESTKHELRKLQKQLESMGSDNSLSAEATRLGAVVDGVLDIVRRSYDESATVDTLLQGLKDAFKQVHEVEQTMNQVNETLSENGRLSHALEEKDQEVSSYTRQLEGCKDELRSLTDKYKTAEEALATKQRDLDDAQKTASDLRSTLEAAQNDARKANDEVKKTKREVDNYQERLQHVEKSLFDAFSDEIYSKKSFNGSATDPVSLIATFKSSMADLSKQLDSKYKQCETLYAQKAELESQITNLRETLAKEESKTAKMEKDRLSQSQQENPTRVSRTLGQLDVSHSFKQQTYERITELQNTIDSLQLGKNVDANKMRDQEKQLTELRDHTFSVLRSLLQKMYSRLTGERARRVDQAMEALRYDTTSAAQTHEKLTSLERLVRETLGGLISDFSTEVDKNAEACSQLQDQLKTSQLSQQEAAGEARMLQHKLSKLEQTSETLGSKVKGLSSAAPSKQSSSNGEVRKEIFKQISGTFVGKIWLSRYHEMEKRWHNERETRRREYDGYKQHLNECYERIESQKKTIHKLQLRIKPAADTSDNK